MIYLDNAATTCISDEVLHAMWPYLTQEFGNPGSVYGIGSHAKDAVQKARSQVAGFLNCNPEQVVFTAGGSDGNTMAIMGCAEHLRGRGKLHVITDLAEHDSVYRAVLQLSTHGFRRSFVQVRPDGTVDPKNIESQIDIDTGLISVMYVNNELDGVNDVERIGKICQDRGILFHVDAVQAAGSHPIDVRKIGCDFLTISGHKIHGPKGVGALYVRDKHLLTPHVFGGEQQEFGLRSGTENVPGIVGLGEACWLISKEADWIYERFPVMKRVFLASLTAGLSAKGIESVFHINSGFDPATEITGKTLSLRFDGIDSETLILMLSANGICVSAGSACHGDSTKPSRVLLAAGLTPEQARNTIRISFSRNDDVHELQTAAEFIANCVELLRSKAL